MSPQAQDFELLVDVEHGGMTVDDADEHYPRWRLLLEDGYFTADCGNLRLSADGESALDSWRYDRAHP